MPQSRCAQQLLLWFYMTLLFLSEESMATCCVSSDQPCTHHALVHSMLQEGLRTGIGPAVASQQRRSFPQGTCSPSEASWT